MRQSRESGPAKCRIFKICELYMNTAISSVLIDYREMSIFFRMVIWFREAVIISSIA